MAKETAGEITKLLTSWRSGDPLVEDALVAQLYPMIRKLAARQLRGKDRPSMTLQATDIANEAFIKLFGQKKRDWQNRNHFLAIAGRVVRRVVVDHLKTRGRYKRGGDVVHVTFDRIEDRVEQSGRDAVDWLTVDQLLNELEEADPGAARLIELRYFAGLTVEEAAEVLETSTSTVVRNWRTARAWLHARLAP